MRVVWITGGVGLFWLLLLAYVLRRAWRVDEYHATRRAGHSDRPAYTHRVEDTGTLYLPADQRPAPFVPLGTARFTDPRQRRPETLQDMPKHAAWTLGEGTTRLVPPDGAQAGRARIPRQPDDRPDEDLPASR